VIDAGGGFHALELPLSRQTEVDNAVAPPANGDSAAIQRERNQPTVRGINNPIGTRKGL
jgi:hypothetical protein